MALCRKSHLNIWACHLRNLDITLLPLLCVVSVPITLPNGSFGSRFEIPFWVPTASLVPVESAASASDLLVIRPVRVRKCLTGGLGSRCRDPGRLFGPRSGT